MDYLFANGLSKIQYPVKLIFLNNRVDSGVETQAMFVVPKKKFKKAHDRNKLKRRMREAYRLQKSELKQNLAIKGLHLSLAFLYIGSKEEPYSVISPSVGRLLNFLTEEMTLNKKN
jgi:ribonuclease P protein component